MIAMLRMARPLQLLAVSMVYIFGALLAMQRVAEWDISKVSWGFVSLLCGAVSIHLANEYADYETDLRARRTLFSGGSGALPEMRLSPRGALVLAWTWVILTIITAGFGMLAGKLQGSAAVLLAIGVFMGWMYSLSPLKLAWKGWGEVLNALLGGVLLPLYGATMISGRIDLSLAIGMAPFALLTFNNMLATTYADRIPDYIVGKYTLATHMRCIHLRVVYALIIALTMIALYATPPDLMTEDVKKISLLAVPFMIWGWRAYTTQHDPLPSVAAMTVFLITQMCGLLFFGGLSLGF